MVGLGLRTILFPSCRYPKISEPFNRCSIAAACPLPPASDDEPAHFSTDNSNLSSPFCGQLGPVYLFDDALSTAQTATIHQLGPNYMFSFQNQEVGCVPDGARREIADLMDGRDGLAPRVVLAYNAQASLGRTVYNNAPSAEQGAELAYDAAILGGTQLCVTRKMQVSRNSSESPEKSRSRVGEDGGFKAKRGIREMFGYRLPGASFIDVLISWNSKILFGQCLPGQSHTTWVNRVRDLFLLESASARGNRSCANCVERKASRREVLMSLLSCNRVPDFLLIANFDAHPSLWFLAGRHSLRWRHSLPSAPLHPVGPTRHFFPGPRLRAHQPRFPPHLHHFSRA